MGEKVRILDKLDKLHGDLSDVASLLHIVSMGIKKEEADRLESSEAVYSVYRMTKILDEELERVIQELEGCD